METITFCGENFPVFLQHYFDNYLILACLHKCSKRKSRIHKNCYLASNLQDIFLISTIPLFLSSNLDLLNH